MVYRYDYGALMGANTTNNNFKPLSEVAGTADSNNMVNALLEAKGLTAGTQATADVMAGLPNLQADSQVELMQNVAGLSESDTAVARGDTWGGSDDTMGKSWLEKIVSGDLDTSNISVEDLYTQGFNRAGDQEGLDYWTKSGKSIQDIAKSFVGSEEATYRTGYHENYGRDADESGLAYWMSEGAIKDGTLADVGALKTDADGDGTPDWAQTDSSGDFNRILQHTGDADEQKETSVRNLLSSELGLHSSDAQRLADTSLHGADGVAGTADDIFTDASEADVNRMMDSGDLGASEVSDKVRMQTAASHMGDYGGGVDDVGATGIHRMLANQEMGTVVSEATGDKWVSDPNTLAKTSADYLPDIQHEYDEDGNIISTTESNVWSLLKAGTQDYGPEDPNKPEVPELPEDPEDPEDPNDGIVVTNKEVDYTPELTSDVEDNSSYGASKEAFDNAAAGIDTPGPDMFIRNSQGMTTGESAKGVRLKRSKKFKTGEAALGTKQLGRQLQIKSLNI